MLTRSDPVMWLKAAASEPISSRDRTAICCCNPPAGDLLRLLGELLDGLRVPSENP